MRCIVKPPKKGKYADGKKILFSLNVNDAQDVASEEFGITLTDFELEWIHDNVGDNIYWYDAMILVIQDLKRRHVKIGKRRGTYEQWAKEMP